MKKLLFLLVAFVLATNVVNAKNDDKGGNETKETSTTISKTVKGMVVDKATGEALAGALVKVDDGYFTYTDFEGNFTIHLTKPNVKLSVGLIAYTTTEILVGKDLNEIKVELVGVE